MRVGIIGAGCVGSVVATRLRDANCDVSLIGTGDRKGRLEKNGIIVNGKTYKFSVLDNEEQQSQIELIIICVKNYQLKRTCEDLCNLVNQNTILLPLLNGISPVSLIKERFPFNRVLYGYISKIDSYRDDDGFKYNIAGDIHFGEAKNETFDSSIQSIRSILHTAGFNVYVDVDMIKGIWKKWMLNVGANQVSALTEADYIQFSKIPEIEVILRLAMGELKMIANKEGVDLTNKDIDELIQYLTTYPYPKKTSMLQDILAHRKTEIESISGELLRLSNKWGLNCPVNKTMFNLIRAKEQAYLDIVL